MLQSSAPLWDEAPLELDWDRFQDACRRYRPDMTEAEKADIGDVVGEHGVKADLQGFRIAGEVVGLENGPGHGLAAANTWDVNYPKVVLVYLTGTPKRGVGPHAWAPPG